MAFKRSAVRFRLAPPNLLPTSRSGRGPDLAAPARYAGTIPACGFGNGRNAIRTSIAASPMPQEPI